MLADFAGIETPAVLLLNLMDVAQEQGKIVDAQVLEKKLGIPVVPFSATDVKHYDGFYTALDRALSERKTLRTDALSERYRKLEGFTQLEAMMPTQGMGDYAPLWLAAKVMEGDAPVTARVEELLAKEDRAKFRQLAGAVKDGALHTGQCKFDWIDSLLDRAVSGKKRFEGLSKFDRLATSKRWGKPLAALLGAFMAQKGLEIAAIGGKDSMSGTFEHIDVPPTLVSFAVTTDSIKNIISPEFKSEGHQVVLLKPEYDKEGLPTTESLKKLFDVVTGLMREGKVAAAYTPTYGGVAEAILKMTMGNDIGFTYAGDVSKEDIFGYHYGAFVLELTGDAEVGTLLGTTGGKAIVCGGESIALEEIFAAYENKLEEIYPMHTAAEEKKEIPTFTTKAEGISYHAKTAVAKPRVLIPVFPGTNCEFDSAKAVERAGAEANIFVINNLSAAGIADSIDRFAKEVKQAQTIFIPGGFSGGDEPDGSGKFITAFFRNPEIKEAVTAHLKEKDGLMIGICNGFQALIKLGLVPYGEIIDTDETCPTLSYNTISRHQSKIVRVRVATEKSPWLTNVKAGDIFSVPISHGEGRILAADQLVQDLAAKGQILTQYVDENGLPTNDIQFNPNGSTYAIEGLISPDGRVLGKMGHAERIGDGLYQNVAGNYDMKLFKSMVEYFK